MPRVYVRRSYSKEELLAALLSVARKLGRTPTLKEFQKVSGINWWKLRRRFGCYSVALRAAGLAFRRPERLNSADMLEDWGRVARKLGHTPSRAEYQELGRYALTRVRARFQGWSRIPGCFLEYLKSSDLFHLWADVMEMALRATGRPRGRPPGGSRKAVGAPLPAPIEGRQRVTLAMLALLFNCGPGRGPRRVFEDRPLMGPPLALPGLAHEPVNEMGVVFLFGMIAHRLGFLVESMRAAFRDCEAKREVEPGRWQRVRIEFEYESRKFQTHKHDLTGCDLIVCWKDTWPERPESLEVLELKSALRTFRLEGAGSRE